MQYVYVLEKIQALPEPLLREVDDFVDFLLARYVPEVRPTDEEYPAALLTRLSASGGSFDWLNDPAEDIYSDADGEAI
jgi:hypothetical protein